MMVILLDLLVLTTVKLSLDITLSSTVSVLSVFKVFIQVGYNPFTNHLLTSWDIQVSYQPQLVSQISAEREYHTTALPLPFSNFPLPQTNPSNPLTVCRLDLELVL